MARSQQFQFKLKITATLALLSVICFFSNISSSHANTANKDISAIKIAELIEDKVLIESESTIAENKPKSIAESLNDFTKIINQGDQERNKVTLQAFEKLVETSQHKDTFEILEIYKKFLQLNSTGSVGDNYEAKLNYLKNLNKSDSWFVNFHIQRLLAIVHSNSRKSDLAIQTAKTALELIPNNLSDEAVNARIIATELIAYLQNLKLNKELAVANTQRLTRLYYTRAF